MEDPPSKIQIEMEDNNIIFSPFSGLLRLFKGLFRGVSIREFKCCRRMSTTRGGIRILHNQQYAIVVPLLRQKVLEVQKRRRLATAPAQVSRLLMSPTRILRSYDGFNDDPSISTKPGYPSMYIYHGWITPHYLSMDMHCRTLKFPQSPSLTIVCKRFTFNRH